MDGSKTVGGWKLGRSETYLAQCEVSHGGWAGQCMVRGTYGRVLPP